ncbi:MAG: glycosyl hydrolase family 95 catalytic domain-containing protein [Blautia hansenii]|uniref:Uncharacterized protein n=1 Tax=Blautia hansenii TaxID=1322 RepID=A0A6N2R3L8_BLAHA
MGKGFYLTHEAKSWEQGLPVGNGQQGAVLLGGVQQERIVLNEESLWYGGKRERAVEVGKEKLEKVRELLEKGEASKAQTLCGRWFVGNPRYTNPYHPAAEAILNFEPFGKVKEYFRGIDLEKGEAGVKICFDNCKTVRELFSSVKYQVTALRMETDKEQGMSFSLGLNRRPFEENAEAEDREISLNGHSGDGVCYDVRCRVGKTDGRVCVEGGYLLVERASYVEIFFCVRTDYEDKKSLDACGRLLKEAAKAGFEEIKKAHIEEYGRLYNNMRLEIEGAEELAQIPADEFLKRCEEPKVQGYLTWLMFSYARYLLISSSYGCALPANLQGIWNGSFTPPWESGYTININLQMNYWMADRAGLGVCYESFFNLIEKMLPNGRKTAKKVYACRGFVAHHNTNLWGDTDITGLWLPAFLWPMGGAWMANQLYHHSEFKENPKEIRERVLPVMKECILFFYDYLYRKSDKMWISGPTVSPENTYRLLDGQEASVAMGVAMDHQIIRELAENYLEGCRRYNTGSPEYETEKMAQEILEHLPPTKIGKSGRILEWQEEYEEVEKGHRHISHLYGLHPGREISEDTPALFEAAKRTLEYRLEHGGGHTGWSKAWIMCFYARLKDKKKFDEQMRQFLANSVDENLWDIHPPFQIDGNFGMAEAVLEALASRRGDVVELLRIIPKGMETGMVTGLCLEGRLKVDFAWKCGKLTKIFLSSGKTQTIELRYHGVQRKVALLENSRVELEGVEDYE